MTKYKKLVLTSEHIVDVLTKEIQVAADTSRGISFCYIPNNGRYIVYKKTLFGRKEHLNTLNGNEAIQCYNSM